MHNFLSVLLVLTLPYVAMAAAKPSELQAAIKAEVPVGEASFSKLFIHVYDAQFWSDSGDWKHPPYALSITYDMNFTPDELADRTQQEMQHVSTLPEDALQGYTQQIRRIYPSVEAGDRITALQKDATTTAFFHNGRPIGTIKDKDFAAAFFGIWLSPKSSEPTMQKQLVLR